MQYQLDTLDFPTVPGTGQWPAPVAKFGRARRGLVARAD
jgi:hypothetical protein